MNEQLDMAFLRLFSELSDRKQEIIIFQMIWFTPSPMTFIINLKILPFVPFCTMRLVTDRLLLFCTVSY